MPMFVTTTTLNVVCEADCGAERKVSINEGHLTAGDERKCGIFLALPSLPSSATSPTPPTRVSAQHPIVRSIELECGTQQMGDFVCALAVWVRV